MTRSSRRTSLRTSSSARARLLLRLQQRDPAAKQLDLRHVSAAYACLVQHDDLIEACGILPRKGQVFLHQLQVDERLLQVELQYTNGIEDLRLGNRTLFLRHAEAARALVTRARAENRLAR